MVMPLYQQIPERSRSANHWYMDETRWLMFVSRTGHRWWLWVIISKDTVAYIIDPSHAARVPGDHLGEHPEGILNADRNPVYKVLLNEDFSIACCWTHVRRDYINIHDTRPALRSWAQGRIDHINELYHLNKQRLTVLADKELFQIADQALRNSLDKMGCDLNIM